MKIRNISSRLALLLAVFASVASASECPTPDCAFASTQKPWPAEAAPATPSYFLGAFAFGLPAGWTRLYASAGETFAVDYPDSGERFVGFTWLRADDVTPFHETLTASGLTARDFHDMVFGLSTRPGVPDPIREDVIATRRTQFRGAADAIVVSRGGLRAYLAGVELPGFDARAVVVTDARPSEALEILALGMTRQDILRIIASIELEGVF